MKKHHFLTLLLIFSQMVMAQTNPKFSVKFYCPRWGSEDMTWNDFAKKVKDAGYDGVETPLPLDLKEQAAIKAILDKNGLELIGQYYQSFEKDPIENLKSFEKYMRSMAAIKPLLIDAQTGKDYFSLEQNRALILMASKISKETGVPIYHETHRNKMNFAAFATKEYLEKIPELRLTLDISHWCNVSESLLEDQAEFVEAALAKTEHIHARVGHQEGPQVNDPRAPEWKYVVDAHLAWWDKIIERKRKAGDAFATITPEFGPSGYLPTLPYTQMPVASQWDINVYMMKLLKERYK